VVRYGGCGSSKGIWDWNPGLQPRAIGLRASTAQITARGSGFRSDLRDSLVQIPLTATGFREGLGPPRARATRRTPFLWTTLHLFVTSPTLGQAKKVESERLPLHPIRAFRGSSHCELLIRDQTLAATRIANTVRQIESQHDRTRVTRRDVLRKDFSISDVLKLCSNLIPVPDPFSLAVPAGAGCDSRTLPRQRGAEAN
jgi:hypothetical protein